MGSVHKFEILPPSNATLLALRRRPLAFLAHYARRHLLGHAVVFLSVLAAVGASVSTQYGLKNLIDVVAAGPDAGRNVWGAFLILVAFIAADNLLWRVGGFAAARSFVAVTGDIRRDLFAHLTGHAPSWYAERLPGALAGRISATATAAFTVANTGSWNVLPPIIAVTFAIAFIGSVNPMLALVLVALALGLGALIYRLARGGTPLHRAYAGSAAAVDGELVDVIGNMGVVRAFGATMRERRRLGARIDAEMDARRSSLIYLERLRLLHAVLTAVLTAGVVGFGILMWQRHQATVGDIVLLTTLAMTILSATRDLA
ncbi:MAG: ABC transporter ATP-binding protein, partial [Rhodospirillales bacterium]|nr:ABC transporter ATP-binding protein [Rhodospirillales bacterium]